jgi:hypothetical protein
LKKPEDKIEKLKQEIRRTTEPRNRFALESRLRKLLSQLNLNPTPAPT